MTNNEIHPAIFQHPWKQCTLLLVNGDAVTVDHPDYLLMPPDRNWVLWVKPQGKGLRFIPTVHIAAIDFVPRSPSAKAAAKGKSSS